jgi:hypothetical protein
METVFLASSGRSGSTWIQEMLTKKGSYRILFEPFHSHIIDPLSKWHYRQYIGSDESGDAFIKVTDSILRGKIRHQWIDQDNQKLFPRKRFLKDIRANLFIAWLKKRFPYVKVIFLTRHPFKVARSRLRLGWEADLSIFFHQDRLMRRHFPDDRHFLESISTPFGRQVAFWSIENLIPLRELSDKNAFALSYEDIKKSPRAELDRISSVLNIQTCELTSDDIKKPSRTIFDSMSEQINLSDIERDEALRILTRFGLDRLYGPDEREAPGLSSRNLFAEF